MFINEVTSAAHRTAVDVCDIDPETHSDEVEEFALDHIGQSSDEVWVEWENATRATVYVY